MRLTCSRWPLHKLYPILLRLDGVFQYQQLALIKHVLIFDEVSFHSLLDELGVRLCDAQDTICLFTVIIFHGILFEHEIVIFHKLSHL